MADKCYKLLVWGMGKYATKFMANGYNGDVLGFIQTNVQQSMYQDLPVYSPQNIPVEYDFIIVANSYSNDVYKCCLENEIPLEKVIFLYACKKMIGMTDTSIIKSVLSNNNFDLYCSEFGIIEESFFSKDKECYSKANTRRTFDINEDNLWPIITDKAATAGIVENYFWQDLWAAKKIIKSGVEKHFDIGSRLDGFIAHLLTVDIDVSMIDIREFPVQIEGLNTIVDDATSLSQIEDNSIQSFSALCSLEHFGLGRYGDPVDPEACFKCFDNIQKKIKSGGNLYIAVPVGRERVEFNAHRVFYPKTIIDCFSKMKLVEFSCCTDNEGIEENVPVDKYNLDTHNGNWRFGLFHFMKE